MATPEQPHKPHWFSADRPIPDRAADQLGRSHFAESIAKAIEGWTGNDSLVIGIFGRWGMGKTSIKNMVLDAIRSNHPRKAEITEFNVWEVANREQITEFFFDNLAITLGKGTDASAKMRKRLVNRLRRYAARLTAGAELSKLFVRGMTGLLILLGALALSLPALGKAVAITLGSVVLVFAAILQFSGKVTGHIADFFEAAVESNRKTIGEIKNELSEDLRKLSRPLLVVIDDADRLTPNELQVLFQLIKVNADFPNLVYLVILDRKVAIDHLKTALSVDGKDYLEKLIQVPFDIPVLSRSRLNEILLGNLDKLLADLPQSVAFDQSRWVNLFVGTLQHFFENLRQANRFLSTFAFHLSLFRTGNSLEVNPIDLIAIEILRVFEPGVYGSVSLNKQLLTGQVTFERDEGNAEAVKAILDQASDARRETVSDLLQELFPLMQARSRFPEYPLDSWERELRVCAEKIFDRYFYFSIPEGDLSQSRIDALLSAAGNREAFKSALLTLHTDNLLEVAVARLDSYKETIPTDHAISFVTALFDIGDLLSENTPGLFQISPAMHGSRIIRWYLKRLATPKERVAVLTVALENTTGLSLPVHFLMIQQQAQAKNDPTESVFITPEALENMKQLCVKKIRDAASSGALAGNPSLIYILYRWKDWSTEEEVKRWCASLLDQSDGVLTLLKAFTHRQVSVTFGDQVEREGWFIRLNELETFVSLPVVNERLRHLLADSFTPEERRAVDTYQQALVRRSQGKKDSGEYPFGDES